MVNAQELIAQTNAAAYGNLTFEEGATLFFRRYEKGAGTDYSSASDALVITNRGCMEVEITVTAGVSQDSLGNITMTDDCAFTDDTKASLYLALTDGEHIVPIGGEEGAVIRTILAGTDGRTETGSTYRFWLVGAVNRNGDWSEADGAGPKVTVTWSAVPGKKEEPEEDLAAETEAELSENSEELKENQDPEEVPGPDEKQGEAEAPAAKEQPEKTEAPAAEEQPERTEVPETEEEQEEAGVSEPEEEQEETGISVTEKKTAETEVPGAGENEEKPEAAEMEEKPTEAEIRKPNEDLLN